jgi:SAM-dependent methyltransferase
LPFRSNTFDTVLCTSVLEHVDNAEYAIAEISRVLKPGGRLLITVPFFYPEHEAPYDFWRLTHHGLRSVLQRHGLVVDDLSAQGGPGLMVAHYLIQSFVQALRMIARRLGPLGRLLDNRIVDLAIAAPQEAVRGAVSYRLSPLSRIATLGYMASAHKPA